MMSSSDDDVVDIVAESDFVEARNIRDGSKLPRLL